MIQSLLVKILLAPFSLLYGIGISIRDFLYRKGIMKRVEFDIPLISVGNLSIGGTGKTPHIEYLIRLLRAYIEVATLSRGYRRKTKGYLHVKPHMSAVQTGDEPLQFARKFQDVFVAVSESRSFGIPQILMEKPDVQVILLDDAFQHLSVKPGLNILLTEHDRLFTDDYLLPSGRLREWRAAYHRADVIVVTKCPRLENEVAKSSITNKIKLLPNQSLYFTYYDYFDPYYIFNPQQYIPLQSDWDVLVICAIANTDYLLNYLEEKVNSVKVMEFEDHHYFDNRDIGRLKDYFDKMDSDKKIILTTEKDAMRMETHKDYLIKHRLPIVALPVQVKFHYDEAEKFDTEVKDFLVDFKV